MNVLLEAMGVQLGTVADRYKVFSATQARRRNQRKTMEATLAERLGECVGMLCSITGNYFFLCLFFETTNVFLRKATRHAKS